MENTPIISRVLPDGTMIETTYDNVRSVTALAVSGPNGEVDVVQYYDLASGERPVPYSPTNNLLVARCVLLPSDIGDVRDVGDLVDDIRRYLGRYVGLSEAFKDIAPYYVLLTWVYDAFNELPYLRFRGDYGTGKTRALTTIGSICYKPFFASGASTVSPIFHILDTFGGTLVLDEADFRFSDATAELTKVLNNGNVRGWPVLRTMTNRHRELNPRAFSVFGPKLIAMREAFEDRALESRFITEETGLAVSSDIPVFVPDTLAAEALVLRNSLLAWRLRAYRSIAPRINRALAGASARTNQIAMALLSIVEDETARARITDHLIGADRAQREDTSEMDEARMLRAVIEAFGAATVPYVGVADVAARFNAHAPDPFDHSLTNKAVGWIIRTRLRIRTTKSRGVYVIPQSERPRIDAIAERYGISSSATPGSVSSVSETDILPPTTPDSGCDYRVSDIRSF